MALVTSSLTIKAVGSEFVEHPPRQLPAGPPAGGGDGGGVRRQAPGRYIVGVERASAGHQHSRLVSGRHVPTDSLKDLLCIWSGSAQHLVETFCRRLCTGKRGVVTAAVQEQDAARVYVDLGGLEGLATGAQRWMGGQDGGVDGAVRVDDHEVGITRPGQGAVRGDGVVDHAYAAGTDVLQAEGVLKVSLVYSVQAARHLVQAREYFVGRQVLQGEREDHGSQLAHAHRGVGALPFRCAYHQSHPRAGQRDDVEPLAAGAFSGT